MKQLKNNCHNTHRRTEEIKTEKMQMSGYGLVLQKEKEKGRQY